MNNSINEWLAQAVVELEKQSAEYEEQLQKTNHQQIDAIIQKAQDGDVASILELKRLANEGSSVAQVALETLYYDGNKKNAVGTIVLRQGLTSIGGHAFFGCRSLEKIVLPKGVTSIGSYAFDCCVSLKEIVLPEGLISIGDRAFFGCRSLEKIVLPEGLNFIGETAFEYCRNLKEIVLPEGLISIGERAFFECSSLEEIVLPEGLNFIYYGAFLKCSSLKKIVLPESLTSIGDDVFLYSSLRNIVYHKKTERLLKEYFGNQWNFLIKSVLE